MLHGDPTYGCFVDVQKPLRFISSAFFPRSFSVSFDRDKFRTEQFLDSKVIRQEKSSPQAA
jgi:hypothetical protein